MFVGRLQDPGRAVPPELDARFGEDLEADGEALLQGGLGGRGGLDDVAIAIEVGQGDPVGPDRRVGPFEASAGLDEPVEDDYDDDRANLQIG